MHASLISQLEAIGGMEEWVLYVAQHLPDGPSPDWQGLRDQLVRPMVFCGVEPEHAEVCGCPVVCALD